MSAASNGLPPGWATTTLGEVASDGVTQGPPAGRGEFTYVDIGSIENGTKRIVEPKRLPASDAPSRARQLLRSGDVVVSMTRPNLNAVALIDDSLDGAIGSSGFHVLRTKTIDPKWIFYRVQTSDFIEAMTSLTQGALYPAVRPKDIARFATSIPPLPEQRRIVAEIEAQFSRLDAGVAALKRVEANLKRYKAAVLKAACDGSLTADWRAAHPDVEPAGGLLRRILAERRRRWEQAELARMIARGKPPRDDRWKARYEEPQRPNPADLPPLAKTWTWATVAQLSSLIQYGSSAKCTTEGDVPVLRMGNITTDGRVEVGELKYLPAKHDEFPELLLSPGDLLFNRTNSAELVGKSAVYRGEPSPCSFASYLIRVRLIEGAEGAEPVYVAACLNSSLGRTWVKSVVSQQVGQANVNGTKLAAFSLPLPPLEEQIEIARSIDDSFSMAEHAIGAIDAAARRASHLRQSILRDAFAGKLVPQDSADEPAAALLERIRAREKSAAPPSRTRARARRTVSSRTRSKASRVE